MNDDEYNGQRKDIGYDLILSLHLLALFNKLDDSLNSAK